MPSSPSPSSSAQAARQRLADQLREMRVAGRISGREFARRAGWSDATTVTKVEKAQRTITADHVKLWCRICGQLPEREAELLAEQQSAAEMWTTHAERNRAGLKGRQELLRDEYWQVKKHRNYQTRVVPGLLQTEATMTVYLTRAREEQHLDIDDVAAAVGKRLERQDCLNRPDARWLFLMEEQVLRYRLTPPEVHADQLRYVLTMMRHPTVSIGIIPVARDRGVALPVEAFNAHDERIVGVELTSGYLRLTQPTDVRLYLEAWGRLAAIAVHGDAARELITDAIGTL